MWYYSKKHLTLNPRLELVPFVLSVGLIARTVTIH